MKPYSFVVDFDSTLVQCESLDELARIALAEKTERERILQKLRTITAQGMAGAISFDESLQRRFALFQAQRRHVDELTRHLLSQISPSALNHEGWFRQNRDRIYVISGGFKEYITPVAARLGIAPAHIRANHFLYDTADNIIGFDSDTRPGKAGSKMAEISALDLAGKIIVIGDGYTDYEIRAHGGAHEFWAFIETIARPTVVAKADRVIGNFSEIAQLE